VLSWVPEAGVEQMLRALDGGLGRERQAEPEDKLACLTARSARCCGLSTWMTTTPTISGRAGMGSRWAAPGVECLGGNLDEQRLISIFLFAARRTASRSKSRTHRQCHKIPCSGAMTRDKLERFRGFAGPKPTRREPRRRDRRFLHRIGRARRRDDPVCLGSLRTEPASEAPDPTPDLPRSHDRPRRRCRAR